jgi:hypothetical protein
MRPQSFTSEHLVFYANASLAPLFRSFFFCMIFFKKIIFLICPPVSRCMVSCGHPSSLGVPEPNPHRRSKPGTPLDRCQNMKLQQRRHKKILLGPSAVAGWGAFVCGGAAAGELLGEYTGELVNDQEAEARGRVYDANNKSFLFQLNDQVCR